MTTKEKTEAKASKNKENIHDGHRARLVDFAINAGLENLSDFQVVELFLSYIFPRGDTNPLAHRLLEKYETFANLIDASVEDIRAVRGMGVRSAKLVKLFNEMFDYYSCQRMGKKIKVKTQAELVDVVEEHLRLNNTENLLFFGLSASNVITHKRRFENGSSHEVGTTIMELSRFLSSAKPATLVVAHGHPYGSAVPSSTDVEAFQKINEFCFACGVRLFDSYIVGEDGVFSLKLNKFVRVFCDIENLKEAMTNLSDKDE